MSDAFKQKLARAWGKRALVETTNMLAHAHAKGYGDDLTPVGRLKRNPGFNPAAYDPDDDKTWPFDPKSGKGAFLSDKANHPNDPNAVPGGWRRYRLTAQDIVRFDREGDGLGIVCRDDPADGKAVAWIDCDITEFGASSNALHTLQSWMAAPGMQFFVRRRGSYSWLVPVRITDGVPAYAKWTTKRGGYSLERGGAGHQFVAGGPHACGAWRYWTRYDQTTETPLAEMPACDELPELTLDQFYKLFEAVAAACGAAKGKAQGGSGAAPSPSGSGFKLLPAEDFDHHAIPKGREAVFLAVLAALPNEKMRDPWVGCMSTLIGAMRKWPEAEVREAALGWCDKYGGDPKKDKKLFDEKWAERGRLPGGWPEFLNWARTEIDYSHLRALGVTDEDMALADAERGESRAALVQFEAALQSLREACTEAGQAPAKVQRRRIIDLAAPMRLPQEPPTITDWHVRGVMGMLSADPGRGKTTLAISTALAIAHERPELIGSTIMDWSGAVVLVLNETNRNITHGMLTAAEKHFGLKHADRKHPIIVWPEPLTLLAKDGRGAPAPTPAATAFVADLAELRGDYPIALVIIDTLASAMSGLDENSASDMQAAARVLSEIAQAGYCAVQIVHHTRKAAAGKQATASDARGSNALLGAARCVTALSSAPSEDLRRFKEDTILRLSCEKQNDARQAAPVFLARSSVSVDVEDPRQPGKPKQREYAVLFPASPVSAFGTRHDVYTAYAALEAAQVAGIELREAKQAKRDGWARPQTVIVEYLGVKPQQAEALFTTLLDLDWVRLVVARAPRLNERGQNKGMRSHGVYELTRPAAVGDVV